VTHEEFSKLTDKEAKAYLLAELKSIASAETFANITEGMLKIFK
jgi:hypothetical protein